MPVESARREAGTRAPRVVPAPGAHLRRRGESIRAGTVLSRAGRRLRRGRRRARGARGRRSVRVYRRPRVAIAVTGNELVPAVREARPGPAARLERSDARRALPRARLGAARSRRRVADEPDAVRAALRQAGGARGHPHHDAAASRRATSTCCPRRPSGAGFEILFHGVADAARQADRVRRAAAETLWFGLPGNPVSTSVCFHVFVRVALDALRGRREPAGPEFVPARLTRRPRASGAARDLPRREPADRGRREPSSRRSRSARQPRPRRARARERPHPRARPDAATLPAGQRRGMPAGCEGSVSPRPRPGAARTEVGHRSDARVRRRPIAYTLVAPARRASCWCSRPASGGCAWRARICSSPTISSAAATTSSALDFRGHGDSGGAYAFGASEATTCRRSSTSSWARESCTRASRCSASRWAASIAARGARARPELPCRALAMISSPADLRALRPKPWKAGAHPAGAPAPRRADAEARGANAASARKPGPAESIAPLAIPKLIVTAEGDWLVDPRTAATLAAGGRAAGGRTCTSTLPGSLHADALVKVVPAAAAAAARPLVRRERAAVAARPSAFVSRLA